ncbi:MAG: hypothetical protein R2851_07140 [Caldilineaceae bacterium]
MSRTLTLFFACLLSLAGLFAVPVRLAAQAEPPPYCQLLSPADCDLLQAAHTAMSTLHAGASSSAFTLQAERIPEMPPATLSIQVDAAARFALDDAAQAQRLALAAMPPADLAAMVDDPPALMGALATILTGTHAATSAQVTVAPELVDFIAATAAEEGDPIPFDLPTTVTLEARLDAGTGYVNFSALADVLPGLRAVGDIWLGVDIIPLLDFLAAPNDADLDVSTLSHAEQLQLGQALSVVGAGFGGPLAPMLAASPWAAQVAPFLVVERLEDGTIDERATATFLTTIDYAALLQSPDVQAAVLDLLMEQEILSPNADTGEIEAALAMVSSVGPPLLQTLGLAWVEQIDPETNYLLQTTLDLDWDLAQFLPLLDPAGAPNPADAPRVRLSQATTPPTTTAPSPSARPRRR